jgi:hypothetical protein
MEICSGTIRALKCWYLPKAHAVLSPRRPTLTPVKCLHYRFSLCYIHDRNNRGKGKARKDTRNENLRQLLALNCTIHREGSDKCKFITFGVKAPFCEVEATSAERR